MKHLLYVVTLFRFIFLFLSCHNDVLMLRLGLGTKKKKKKNLGCGQGNIMVWLKIPALVATNTVVNVLRSPHKHLALSSQTGLDYPWKKYRIFGHSKHHWKLSMSLSSGLTQPQTAVSPLAALSPVTPPPCPPPQAVLKGAHNPWRPKRTQEYMLCGIRTGLIVILCSYIRETFISAIFSAYLSAVIQKWPEIILRKTEGCSQKTEPSPTDRHFMSSQRHYMVLRKKKQTTKTVSSMSPCLSGKS